MFRNQNLNFVFNKRSESLPDNNLNQKNTFATINQ